MIIYLVLIGLPFFLLLIPPYETRRKNKVIISAFFIFLLMMLCLRSEKIGNDIHSYLDTFNRVGKEGWDKFFYNKERMEIGYLFLNKVLYILGNNKQWFLSMMALICISPIAVLYYKNSENACLTIAIFLILPNFAMLFSGIRQAIAISIGCISYYCVKKKKFILFIITVFIACLFHKSSIVLLILYPIYYVRITKEWLFFIVPLFICTLLFNKQLITFLMSFFTEYSNSYNSLLVANNQNGKLGSILSILLLVIFAMYSFMIPDNSKMDSETLGLRNILLVAIFIQLFDPINYLVSRFNFYFFIFIPLLIPKITNRIDGKSNMVVELSKCIMISAFIAYFFYGAFFGGDALNIFPYIAFFNI